MSGEPKTQEQQNTEYHHKCRIPQRLTPGRQRPLPKPKPPNVEHRNKVDVISPHPPPPTNSLRCTTRPNSSEPRPKSANRASDVVGEPAHSVTASKSIRPERERHAVTQKKPPLYHRKAANDKFNEMAINSKSGKQIITVPLKQKKATFHNKLSTNLPDQVCEVCQSTYDQRGELTHSERRLVLNSEPPAGNGLIREETIKKCEELELRQEDFSEAAHMYNSTNDLFLDFNEEESVTSRSDKITHLQSCWQEKIVQFEEMKNDLNDRQNGILEVYASLRNTKQKLMSMGQRTELPSTDDLRIMNVANINPNQLLQLCGENKTRKDVMDNQAKNALTIDLKKFNEIPLKLVATCEQTLATRKGLIDWFENLKNQEKGCPKSSLSKKINEFYAESEMLSCTLEIVKNEFLNELNDVIRTCFNERVALQLRTEELTCEVSELFSQNNDLKKQLYNAEKQKTYINKMRIEELEKELKEEKIRKMTMRDRLSRTEGQVKMEADRANLLEAALKEARSQTRNLERTVQQQHEQNQQLQKDFAVELNKLKESMEKNTTQLEEIASARETLQHEKEDLKRKLEKLSSHYNDSLATMKEELNKSIAKLIDVEKKYNDEIENKKKLLQTIESQCAHLLEYELRYKDTTKQLQEMEKITNELINYKKDFEQTRHELDESIASLENYKKIFSEQNDKIKGMEDNLRKSHEEEKKLRSEINKKEVYIATLEKQHDLLQHQSQENECKMQVYEDQLKTLKNHLTKLQEHFIEFEDLNELHELVNRQTATLTETRRKNDEISEELEKKQNELKHLVELIAEHEHLIQQRQSVLQMLSEKEEEQSNVLKLNKQITEKNAEIDSLITNIGTRKEQISQLEKIILTIEDLNRKSAIQKRKDEEKIHALEQKIAEYEYYIASKNSELAAPENLDNLIKILEDELGTPFESQMITTNQTHDSGRNENIGNRNELNYVDYYGQKESNYPPATKSVPTKIVMGNFVKKTYMPNNDIKYKNDNYLPRKQVLKNIDKQKWMPVPDAENTFAFIDNNNVLYGDSKNHQKTERIFKNLHYVLPNQVKDEKKCKMFKFASHRVA